jgi:hypothetical protein
MGMPLSITDTSPAFSTSATGPISMGAFTVGLGGGSATGSGLAVGSAGGPNWIMLAGLALLVVLLLHKKKGA